MDVRPRRDAGNRASEREERNATIAQERDERLPFGAVGVHRDVDRWGVLTIGTGLGNARFTNRRRENGKDADNGKKKDKDSKKGD